MRAEELAEQARLHLQSIFGAGGLAGAFELPADPRAADQTAQTIGTSRVSAEAQTEGISPFSVDSDVRFPLEGFRASNSLPRIS